jgi:uncharacterized protein (TIGR03435 family)
MKTTALTRVLWFCMAGSAFGQPPAAPLRFEVASVKPSAPDGPGMFIRPLPGGGLRVSGASLKNLISLAYGVRWFQISGPEWIDTERFDIEARAETSDAAAPVDPAKLREEEPKIYERLRSLLADRFHLTLHRETREQPVYALMVAKNGPKFEESTDPRGMIRAGRGTVKGQAVAIAALALNLSNVLGRRVIDKTGLAGKYSFELKWSPDQPSAAPPGQAPPGAELPPAADSNGPSIFTALTEQLGLRLESQKGPVEMLVIARAEKPSEN